MFVFQLVFYGSHRNKQENCINRFQHQENGVVSMKILTFSLKNFLIWPSQSFSAVLFFHKSEIHKNEIRKRQFVKELCKMEFCKGTF